MAGVVEAAGVLVGLEALGQRADGCAQSADGAGDRLEPGEELIIGSRSGEQGGR